MDQTASSQIPPPQRSVPRPRALIVGGGVAGPALALFLQRAGVEATIFEARSAAETVAVLGELTVNDVEAVVLPKGRLEVSLLGMSFLRKLGSFNVSQGRLSLRR